MADGIVIVDKPAGWTSMDVCAKIRGILRERRVGHSGTLDPMATGVLPVFVGRATKAVPFAEDGPKEYVAGLRLGTVTDTQDVTGAVLETRPVEVGTAEIEAVLDRFRGPIMQVPPMYSALKVRGRRLYALAREGQEVERAPRPVTIFELVLLDRVQDTDWRLRCVCSKGTYLRTLCHDIGQALGCGGTMWSLRRTMAAGFREADAVDLDRIAEEREAVLRPLDSLFADRPALTVPTPGAERRIRSGAPIRTRAADGIYRVYGQDGTFLCLSRAADGELASIRNFFGG